MTLKLLLLLASAAAGLLGGLAYRRTLLKRKSYFSALKRFLLFVRSDLKFRRTDIVSLSNGFACDDPAFARHLGELTAGLKNGEKKLSKGLLTAEEKAFAERTLFGIGRVDAETQLLELEGATEEAAEREKAAGERLKKYGDTAVKLGFLAGLALGVLLL